MQFSRFFLLAITAGGSSWLLAAEGDHANLVPPLPAGWESSSPRPDLAPAAEVTTSGGTPLLRLKSTGPASYGEWHDTVKGISGGQAYRFEVQYRPDGIANESMSVPVVLSWLSRAGKAFQRDYVSGITPAADGWRRVARTLQAPANAVAVTIELVLRWSPSGSVVWKDPSLTIAQESPHRKIRVVTTSIRSAPPTTVQKNLDYMAATLDRAGILHPDLVVMTECMLDDGVDLPMAETAQPIPGPATDALGEKARRYKMWVVAAIHESDHGLIYDTAVLIDRTGRVAGKYRKVQLTLGEAELGTTPGADYPVFNTDFGRVGMMICWDNFFPEPARILALNGAEIIAVPINGDGVPGHWDVTTRSRAIDNSVFLIESSMYVGSPSVVIDPDGKVLASTVDGIASAEIDLDQTTHVQNLSVGAAIGEPRGLFLKERHPDTYGPLIDAPASYR